MKIKVDFSGLEAALLSIGGKKADIGTLRNMRKISNPIEQKILDGGSVVLSGAELAEHLSTVGGLLAIESTQITLHIFEPYESEEHLCAKPAIQTRFHVTERSTIEDMRNKGRTNRYVSANRQDGLFEVRPHDKDTGDWGKKMEANLQPCYNCLMSLNYDGFAEVKTKVGHSRIISEFELSKFFADFQSIFRCLPLYTPETFPNGGYPRNWARISRETRSKAVWICSCCGLDCSKQTSLLHVHHRDGNQGNIKPSNLEVLCIACHKARPFHGNLSYSSQNKMRLQNLRISQKKPKNCAKCKI